MQQQPLKVMLTGGTGGIGLQLTKVLVAQGHHVRLACRTPARGAAALDLLPARAKQQVKPVVCDLHSFSSVHAAAKQILDEESSGLDVLVLNAAAVNQRLSINDGVESTLMVNHVSQFLLLQLLMPSLKQSKCDRVPRVVLTSSELYQQANKEYLWSLFHWSPALSQLAPSTAANTPPASAYKGMQAYSVSKLYNAYTARVLAEKEQGLWVAAVTPGFVPTTQLNRDSGRLTQLFMEQVLARTPFATTVEEGAARVQQVVSEPTASTQATSGSFWSRKQPAKLTTDVARDLQAARQLWDISLKAVQS